MLMGIRKTERATEDDRSFRCVVAAVDEGRIIEPRPSGMVNADDDGDVLERANVARRVGRSWRTIVSNRNEERKKCCGRVEVFWWQVSSPSKNNLSPGGTVSFLVIPPPFQPCATLLYSKYNIHTIFFFLLSNSSSFLLKP